MVVLFEYSIISVFAAGTLQIACSTAASWSSPAIPKLKAILPFLSIEQESWLGSIMPMGAIFGPYFFGYLADKIGRKYALLGTALPTSAAYLLMAFSRNFLWFYIARFITGFTMGGCLTVLPIYVGEVSSGRCRGFLGATISVFFGIGVLVSYVLGPFLKLDMFNLVYGILPLVAFAIFLILGVESPYYYVSINEREKARDILEKIRNDTDSTIQGELAEIKCVTDSYKTANLLDIFKSKSLLKGEIICMGLVFFNQGTGINSILSFSQQIFDESGTKFSSEMSSLTCGIVLVISTIMATFIIHIFKRRILYILSTIGIVVSFSLLGTYLCLKERNTIDLHLFSFVPLTSLALFILMFNLGLGSLIFVSLGEYFPTDLRASASALNSSMLWLISFLLTRYFKPIASSIGLGETFLVLAGVSVLSVIFCAFFVVETKDKSLKQIQDELNN